MNADVAVFANSKSVFSNLHPMQVTIDGYCFNCNEQFIQYSKAKLFKDTEASNKILEETDPYKQMALGKKIKGFKKQTWESNIPGILNRVNRAKYIQHPDAKQALMNTGERRLGEATKDPHFGIGMNLYAKTVLDPNKWTSKNLMGQILQNLRKDLV